MAMVDVTVMGAGIFGLSVAYACARRGAKVRIVEQRAPGAGSSGGVVGALAPHVPENWNPKKAFQLESLLMARAYWAEIETKTAVPSGYARLGRLQPLADAAAIDRARDRERSARDVWQEAARWRVVDAVAAGGWRPESPTGQYVFDDLSARISPSGACAALLDAACREHGAELTLGSDPGLAGRVVWTTGYEGLRELTAQLGRPIGDGVKGQAVAFAHDARDMPQMFSDGLHIVPHFDGTVGVGSTSERAFDTPDGTDAQAEALVQRARGICPALRDAPVVQRWAGVRPRARTRAPILGPWPGRAGHFIANGGFKIGFGIAPKVGEVMADLVLDGTESVPVGFRVEDCL